MNDALAAKLTARACMYLSALGPEHCSTDLESNAVHSTYRALMPSPCHADTVQCNVSKHCLSSCLIRVFVRNRWYPQLSQTLGALYDGYAVVIVVEMINIGMPHMHTLPTLQHSLPAKYPPLMEQSERIMIFYALVAEDCPYTSTPHVIEVMRRKYIGQEVRP